MVTAARLERYAGQPASNRLLTVHPSIRPSIPLPDPPGICATKGERKKIRGGQRSRENHRSSLLHRGAYIHTHTYIRCRAKMGPVGPLPALSSSASHNGPCQVESRQNPSRSVFCPFWTRPHYRLPVDCTDAHASAPPKHRAFPSKDLRGSQDPPCVPADVAPSHSSSFTPACQLRRSCSRLYSPR